MECLITELTTKQIYRREYYQRNKEKATQQIRARYLAKREELLEYQRVYRIANKERIRLRDLNKKRQRQQEAIEYLGGKCKDCAQSYPAIVYDFHHINPEEKEFMLSEAWADNKEKLWNELNKCVLLCANCHRLRHMEEF